MPDSIFDLPLVGLLLEERLKPKRRRVQGLTIGDAEKQVKESFRRTVRKCPEVMVKVSGAARGAKHLKAHMDYVSRNGKLDVETERGEVVRGRPDLKDLHAEWAADLGPYRKNGRDTVNVVLSMPPGTPTDAVLGGARNFALERFGGSNKYLLVLHTDEKHPHVHLTVKAQGYDGKKLDPRKADLQAWREQFAEKMREQGVECGATPRRVRGKTVKPKRLPVYHVERTGRSYVQAAKMREAADALVGKRASMNPARRSIVQTQRRVREAWTETAVFLGGSALPSDRELATEIRGFVATLPKQLEDERLQLQRVLYDEVAQRTSPDREGRRDMRPKQRDDPDQSR